MARVLEFEYDGRKCTMGTSGSVCLDHGFSDRWTIIAPGLGTLMGCCLDCWPDPGGLVGAARETYRNWLIALALSPEP